MKALRVRKVALCALFICIAAVLSAVESFLPPICAIPGVRVGLRCFVAAFITGQVMNLFYGVMGGICALGVMLLMRKLLPGENRENWLPLVGIMGALAHIAGQMLTAVIIYGNILVLAYTPILTASAVIGGAFTGTCTLFMLKKLDHRVLDDIRMTDIPTMPKFKGE